MSIGGAKATPIKTTIIVDNEQKRQSSIIMVKDRGKKTSGDEVAPRPRLRQPARPGGRARAGWFCLWRHTITSLYIFRQKNTFML